jgi:hypothetical protein
MPSITEGKNRVLDFAHTSGQMVSREVQKKIDALIIVVPLIFLAVFFAVPFLIGGAVWSVLREKAANNSRRRNKESTGKQCGVWMGQLSAAGHSGSYCRERKANSQFRPAPASEQP